MTVHAHFMQRAVDIARSAAGKVSPNPLVGAVLVIDDKIIAEGWHRQYGKAHAEVNAIAAAGNQSLTNAVLYVNLEPCSHHGKTPPCTELIIQSGIKAVVVGMEDPFPLVAGRGIQNLRNAGITVIENVLYDACRELNKRFITYHEKKRPFVILKWAETSDGFIAPAIRFSDKDAERYITGYEVQKLVHSWRAQEDAVLVGTSTVKADNPLLNVREWKGRNPLRVTIDREITLSPHLHFFDGFQPTLVFTSRAHKVEGITYAKADFSTDLPQQILNTLHDRSIQSVIIEGGTRTISSFVEAGLWDEARVFTAPARKMISGVSAPVIHGSFSYSDKLGSDTLTIYRNA